MGKKLEQEIVYFSVGVGLPYQNTKAYQNFITNKGRRGVKTNPTRFEQRLPKDWEIYSRSRLGEDNHVCSVTYNFPEHKKGLSLDEMLQITRAAVELGASHFGFKGIAK